MLASWQWVLTTIEIDHLRQHQVVLIDHLRQHQVVLIDHLRQHQVVPRYLIMEYWSGRAYCVIDPEPQMFDGD